MALGHAAMWLTALLLCVLLASSPFSLVSARSVAGSAAESLKATNSQSPKIQISRISPPSTAQTITTPSLNLPVPTSSPSTSSSPSTFSSPNTTQIGSCIDCISFFQKNLNSLILIVEKGGSTYTCDKLCGFLNSTDDINKCSDMCEDMGADSFWQLFVKVDINPIYACELVNACTIGKSPAATFTSTSIVPPYGPPGTTFEFKMQFTVVNDTGVGETAFVIYYPSYDIGFISQDIFPDYPPGDYVANLTFPTNSSFTTGKYLIIFDICSGTCGLDPFAHTQLSFNITNLN